MLPDYPHKMFNDKRVNYSLLMEALAMDALITTGIKLLEDLGSYSIKF
jgi:hypothetical protein